MKLVGERIREQRLRLGLSIEDVARRSASSINLIKELEWSMVKDIDMGTLISVAAAVELRASDLLA
jgi:transcriptional regulator with XRE-family HTH domain